MRNRLLVTLACSTTFVIACGDTTDPAGTDTSADVSADAGTDVPIADESPSSWYDSGYVSSDLRPGIEACADLEDNDADGDIDCLDSDCSEHLICGSALTAEVEPNNSKETAQELSLPIGLKGEIGSFTVDVDGDHDEDRDWFAFEISEPAMVRWEFDDANGLALLQLALFGLDDDTDHVSRRLDIDTPGAVRHTYLPRAGRYGVEVRDLRNTRRSGEELPYGGPGFAYGFSLESVTFSAVDIALPFETEGAVEFGAENALPVYSVSLTTGGVFEAEVFAQRLEPTSGLDAILYLVNETDDSIVRFEDDPSTPTVDPLIRTGILSDGIDGLLIVDAFRVSRQSTHTLRAEMLEPSLDWEPNNPTDLAYPIEVGSTVEGEIGAPTLRYRSTLTDRDYFYLPGGPSASYEIEVSAVGANLDVSVRTGWLGYSNGAPVLGEVFTADPDGDRDARLETVSLYDRTVFIEVADRRNLFDDESDPVGADEGFEYELVVTAQERTIEPLALPADVEHELSSLGEVDWYALSSVEKTLLRVSADAAEGAAPELNPWIYLTTDADTLLRRREGSLNYLSTFETDYRLGVVDRKAGGGADYDYSLVVESVAFSAVDEVEPNDGPPEGGQILSESGSWWVTGTTSGANEGDFDADVFVVTLEEARLLVVETIDGGDAETDNADTVVMVSGVGLDEPASDDNGGIGDFSLLQVEIVQAGSYEITVTPSCNDRSCAGGDYSLVIWTEDIPADDE